MLPLPRPRREARQLARPHVQAPARAPRGRLRPLRGSPRAVRSTRRALRARPAGPRARPRGRQAAPRARHARIRMRQRPWPRHEVWQLARLRSRAHVRARPVRFRRSHGSPEAARWLRRALRARPACSRARPRARRAVDRRSGAARAAAPQSVAARARQSHSCARQARPHALRLPPEAVRSTGRARRAPPRAARAGDRRPAARAAAPRPAVLRARRPTNHVRQAPPRAARAADRRPAARAAAPRPAVLRARRPTNHVRQAPPRAARAADHRRRRGLLRLDQPCFELGDRQITCGKLRLELLEPRIVDQRRGLLRLDQPCFELGDRQITGGKLRLELLEPRIVDRRRGLLRLDEACLEPGDRQVALRQLGPERLALGLELRKSWVVESGSAGPALPAAPGPASPRASRATASTPRARSDAPRATPGASRPLRSGRVGSGLGTRARLFSWPPQPVAKPYSVFRSPPCWVASAWATVGAGAKPRVTTISPSGRPVAFCSVSASSSCSSVMCPRLTSSEPRGSARIRCPPLSGSAATPSPFRCRRFLSASATKRVNDVPLMGHAAYGAGMTSPWQRRSESSRAAATAPG